MRTRRSLASCRRVDPAARLHAVEQAGNADRLDFENLGEPRLRHALVLDQPDQQPPLRRRQAIVGAAHLEALAQQALRVVDQEAQPVDAVGSHERHIL